MKVAVYTGTRNLYADMIPAVNSLLIHSDVDKIYLLIEDDIFPYPLPKEVECINISHQAYFRADGPNFNSPWTYMVLIRAALSKIFPQYDTILSLDVDTIVNENISSLWDIDLGNNYLAAAKEPFKSINLFYINMGVVLFNLKAIREAHIDDKIIEALNTKYYEYNEQDCISELCQNKIIELPADYNVCNYTAKAKHRSIIHFAAIKNWNTLPIVQKYRTNCHERNIDNPVGLDIIIPTYNNFKGLQLTLDSIFNNNIFSYISNIFPIVVTVIDDCSSIDYSDIYNQYPINFYKLEQNSGPGIARQYGIEHSNMPYLMFIDTEDYLISPFSLLEIIYELQTNTMPYVYLWRWLNEENKQFSSNDNGLLHGYVYKREFLELYHIKFSTNSPYSNEDIGFNHTCDLILRNIALYDETEYKTFKPTPIYFYTYNPNSITHKNKNEFFYTKQIRGLISNIEYALEVGELNKIDKRVLWEEVSYIIVELFYDFFYILRKRKEYACNAWPLIRQFYLNKYKQYEQKDLTVLRATFAHKMPLLLKLNMPKININKFLYDLEKFETIPDEYLTFFKN